MMNVSFISLRRTLISMAIGAYLSFHFVPIMLICQTILMFVSRVKSLRNKLEKNKSLLEDYAQVFKYYESADKMIERVPDDFQ